MTVRAMFHICMELWGIFICLICAGGIFIATPRKTKRTRIKILMQIACMLLLGADALSWYFHADAGETAYYMIRISNFSVFCINYIFMSFFATYVWLTVSKNQHRKPAALHTVYALSVIGILLLIITQFTGLFYYFDDHNLYHRGNFYLLSQAIAVLGIALCLFMLISYRKNLERITFFSMMSFFVLPVLATIYQALAYGFSLQCLAIVISTQIMFVMDTVEMNMRFYSQQAAYEKARYEAEHDGMTGLLNKKAGWKHMRKYFDRMDSHDEAMLMFVDIDDFKIINDTYGHTVGDFWIREVASQLRHIYRQDDIICRYGGDEFIVLIRNTASEQVLETTLGSVLPTVDTRLGTARARRALQRRRVPRCRHPHQRKQGYQQKHRWRKRRRYQRRRGFRPMRQTGRSGAVRNQAIQQRNIQRLQLRPLLAGIRNLHQERPESVRKTRITLSATISETTTILIANFTGPST